MRKEDVIKALDLKPLIGEGGFEKDMYRDSKITEGKINCGTCYYMLTPNCFSCMHKLSTDEIWYYHDGPALEMLLVYEDHSEVVKIGKDVLNNEHPQFVVPKGVYQGCHMAYEGEYTLVSTSMAPAYDPNEFVVGTYKELEGRAENKDLLKLLTGEPLYK